MSFRFFSAIIFSFKSREASLRSVSDARRAPVTALSVGGKPKACSIAALALPATPSVRSFSMSRSSLSARTKREVATADAARFNAYTLKHPCATATAKSRLEGYAMSVDTGESLDPPVLSPAQSDAVPTWRAAYSDRTSALMAAFCQLAYVPFGAATFRSRCSQNGEAGWA